MDICLLRRHVFKSHYPIPSLTRYASTPSREPYILPRLVIDLDANDSQFVREATEDDYAVPSKPRRRQRHDLGAREESAGKEVQINPKTPQAFHLCTATAPDLMQYALLGNPFASPKNNNAELRKVFSHYKVHDLDNADSKVKRLTFNFTADSSKLLEGAGFTAEREPLVLEQIRECYLFVDLKRMVSTISSTVEGCKFLAANGADIVEGIMRCRKAVGAEDRTNRGPTAANILRLLNNMHLNMQSKMVSIGPDLCNAALYYASKTFCLSSVRTYLKVLRHKNYRPKKMATWAMNHLAINQRRGPDFQSMRNQYMDNEERKRQVLKLMTGWKSNGTPQHQEKRQISFGSTVVTRSYGSFSKLVYATYIESLGYLGASDALWREWQYGLRTMDPASEALLKDDILDSVAARDLREKTEVFALAFLMADNPERALHVLETFLELDVPHTSPNLESPTNVLCDHTRHRILWYYKSSNLVPTERLQEQIGTQFSSEEPRAIFQKLNDMLIPKWVDSRESTEIPFEDRFVRYSVDWIEIDGVEGVAIKDTGQKIIYFKSSSQRPASLDTEALLDSSRSSVDK